MYQMLDAMVLVKASVSLPNLLSTDRMQLNVFHWSVHTDMLSLVTLTKQAHHGLELLASGPRLAPGTRESRSIR